MAVLAAFMWFWNWYIPETASVRQTILLQRWQSPERILHEILDRFPWTLLSTVKLTIVPIAALMCAARPRKPLRMLVLGTPFVAATSLTFVFFDITRVATMLVMPALLVTLLAAATDSTLPPRARRSLRRLLIVTALLNLLIPNYYVNDGDVEVPGSQALGSLISGVARLVD